MFPLKQLLVLFIVLSLVLLLLVAVVLMCRSGWRFFFNPGLRLASFNAGEGHRKHLDGAIDTALPIRNVLYRGACKDLAIRLLNTYAREVTALREEGTAPLLSSTYDIYAQCVADLMETLAKKSLVPPPTIYTVYKKPIVDWYNLFSDYIEMDGQVVRVVFTDKWWEKYKSRVAEFAASDSGIRMYRYILHPPKIEEQTECPKALLSKYFVHVGSGGCTHVDARPVRQLLGLSDPIAGFKLIQPVEALLKTSSDRLRGRIGEASIHRIATYSEISTERHGDESASWQSLLRHFHCAYHTGPMTHEYALRSDKSGVFYGYVENVCEPFRTWLRYRDVFAVSIPAKGRNGTSEAFGIALYDDASLDITGIRILPERDVNALVDAFKAQETSSEFSIYRGPTR